MTTSLPITKADTIPSGDGYLGIFDPALAYIVYVLIIGFITPVSEEILFRSWIRLRFQNIFLIAVFALFLIQMYFSFGHDNSFQVFLLGPFKIFQDLLAVTFSSIINSYFQAAPVAFDTLLGIPYVIIILIAFHFILLLKKIWMGDILQKAFSKVPINILLLLNGLCFFIFHMDRWENGILLVTWIFFIPFCFVFPFIAYRFGLKASIYLHSVSNFIVFYVKVYDLTAGESALYNLTFCTVTVGLIYLFTREIRIGLAREKRC